MLLVYWAVCKFDLILAIPSILTSITTRHYLSFQCIAIAFRILMLSANFVVSLLVQCYFAYLLTILTTA